MLLRFTVRNFRSFKQETELSLVASNLTDAPGAVISNPAIEQGALRVAAIYGANGSGKSNLLLAFSFMRVAVLRSHRSWVPDAPIPREEFLLDPASASDDSLFEVELVLNGTRFRYGFTLTSDRITAEWLHAYPGRRRQTWFERKDTSFTFSKRMGGANRTIASLTRANSLFLSAAAQNGHDALIPLYNWFTKQWELVTGHRGFLTQGTAEYCASTAAKERIERLLAAADLGISRVEIREEKLDDRMKRAVEGLLGLMGEEDWAKTAARDTRQTIAFLHRAGGDSFVSIDEHNESTGTVAFFGLLGFVARALERGGVLLIDELDASMHTLLAAEIVRLFNDPTLNPNGAQLIFNSHDITLLDGEVLRRDQVWFTEKDDSGQSHLYALTDFKPRRGENVRNGYMQGRYGAVPMFTPDGMRGE